MWKPLLLATCLIGFVPVAARSPLDREPVMAGMRLFFGPSEGFETIDLSLLNRARIRIDMAAYVLTDKDVIDALRQAAGRGVKVRVYLDPEQASRRNSDRLDGLARTVGVEIRIKSGSHDMMHLKAYQVDNRFFRTGSANFSFSGERRQDNDILAVESRDAAGAFAARFDELWARHDNEHYR
jgi:phosphatidylserine/phosphatidylglycerophosphate/cardiolipin synthase-like enzyme